MGRKAMHTQEQVFEAADRLAATGREVTPASLREYLGGGSLTTIYKHHEAWAAARAAQAAPVASNRSQYRSHRNQQSGGVPAQGERPDGGEKKSCMRCRELYGPHRSRSASNSLQPRRLTIRENAPACVPPAWFKEPRRGRAGSGRSRYEGR